MKLSVSALKDYLLCPYKYRVFYIEKRRSEFDVPSAALSFGRSIHNCLRRFYQEGKFPRYSLNDLLNLLGECWQREGYRDGQEESVSFEEARLMLTKYYESFRGEVSQHLRIEQNMSALLHLEKEPLILSGRLDRLDLLPDGSLEVIDYKTGRGDQQKAPWLKEDIAAPIYLQIARTNFPRFQRVKLSMIYLRPMEKATVELDDEELQQGLLKVVNIARNIKAETRFEGKRNDLCPWCGIYIKGECPLFSST